MAEHVPAVCLLSLGPGSSAATATLPILLCRDSFLFIFLHITHSEQQGRQAGINSPVKLPIFILTPDHNENTMWEELLSNLIIPANITNHQLSSTLTLLSKHFSAGQLPIELSHSQSLLLLPLVYSGFIYSLIHFLIGLFFFFFLSTLFHPFFPTDPSVRHPSFFCLWCHNGVASLEMPYLY